MSKKSAYMALELLKEAMDSGDLTATKKCFKELNKEFGEKPATEEFPVTKIKIINKNIDSKSFVKEWGLVTGDQIILSGESGKGKTTFALWSLLTLVTKSSYLGVEIENKPNQILWVDADGMGEAKLLDMINSFKIAPDEIATFNEFNQKAKAQFTEDEINKFLDVLNYTKINGTFSGANDIVLIDELNSKIASCGADIVILDTLAGISSAEENGSKMKDIVYMIQNEIAKKLNVMVLMLVHKSAKSGSSQSFMGHSGIKSACDQMLIFDSSIKGLSKIKVEKARGSASGLRGKTLNLSYSTYSVGGKSERSTHASTNIFRKLLQTGLRGVEILPFSIELSETESVRYDISSELVEGITLIAKIDKRKAIREILEINPDLSGNGVIAELKKVGVTGRKQDLCGAIKTVKNEMVGGI